MVLPVTLDYHADETAIDFVARLAAANGFSSLRSFLGHTDVTAKAVVQGEAEALSMVSEWSGITVPRLAKLAVVAFGIGGNWKMGRATLSKDMRPGRTHRFCARCILEDRKAMSGRLVSRAYRRAWWSIRGIEGCQVHDCALHEVTVTSEHDIHDFPRFVQANLAQIESAASAALPSSQPMLDRYLRERVFQDGGSSFLDTLDLHVAAEFSRYLGDLLVLHDIRHQMLEGKNVHEWGFLLASKGEAAIQQVIADVVHHNPPRRKRVETVIGPMVLWLRRNIAKVAYRPIVNLVQDTLERNVPFGPGETILKPVVVRHLHSVITAQEEFGLHAPRIRTLMQEQFPGLRMDRPDGETYFDAVIAEPILRAATETLTSKQTADVLGVTEAMMQDLLDAGIVVQVEKRTGEERAYTRISRSAVSDLEHRLAERLLEIESDVGLSLVAAARVSRRPYHSLVSMILDGTLDASALAGKGPVLNRVRVRQDGLKLALGPTAGVGEQWLRAKEVERVLGTTTATVSELIKRGYLRVQSFPRETGGTVKLIERRSLEEFGEVYSSLSDIAKSRQGFRAAIKAELEAAGVTPIFEPTGFIARFYRKSDLTQIG